MSRRLFGGGLGTLRGGRVSAGMQFAYAVASAASLLWRAV